MRALNIIMWGLGLPVAAVCVILTVWLIASSTQEYEPIKRYEIETMGGTACTDELVGVHLKAFIENDFRELQVDPMWVRLSDEYPQRFEEPIANFTPNQIPEKLIDRQSRIAHTAPSEPDMWQLVHRVTAIEEENGINDKTQTLYVEAKRPLLVREC